MELCSLDVCENASTLGHACGLTGSRSPRSRAPYSALCEPPTLKNMNRGNPATRRWPRNKERGAFGGKECCARGWVAHTGLSRWVRLYPLCSLPVPPSSLISNGARLAHLQWRAPDTTSIRPQVDTRGEEVVWFQFFTRVRP